MATSPMHRNCGTCYKAPILSSTGISVQDQTLRLEPDKVIEVPKSHAAGIAQVVWQW